MISQCPRETTETNIEWIGELPSQWSVGRVKNTSYLKARVGWKGLTSDEFKDSAYAYLVTGTDFRQKYVEWSNCYQVDQSRFEDDPFIQLQNGDLLITKDGTIGKLAMVSGLDKPACLNSGIFVVRPNCGFENEFMYWVLSSNLFSIFCDLESFGSTINHLYQNVFERFQFPMPSISEQRSIALYLDTETEKIDALVAEQRRLIELLKEKRQAVISHAVTKGLNPDAPRKPSGIEWLGDVPEHWHVMQIGYFATVENGCTPSRDNPEYWDNGTIPWLSSGEVNQSHVTEPSRMITQRALHECSLRLLPEETVIVGMVGQGKTRGLSAILKLASTINQNLAAIIPDQSMNSQFLHFVLHATYAFLRELGRGGQQAALNCEILRRFRVPVPPIDEQISICSTLGIQLTKFDALEHSAVNAISLLQERRTALISAAVTGKIDVRNYRPDQAA